MRKTESQKIALCGVLGALSVVLLLVGAALQIGTYAAPMLAAFLLIPVLDEYGPKYAPAFVRYCVDFVRAAGAGAGAGVLLRVRHRLLSCAAPAIGTHKKYAAALGH